MALIDPSVLIQCHKKQVTLNLGCTLPDLLKRAVGILISAVQFCVL